MVAIHPSAHEKPCKFTLLVLKLAQILQLSKCKVIPITGRPSIDSWVFLGIPYSAAKKSSIWYTHLCCYRWTVSSFILIPTASQEGSRSSLKAKGSNRHLGGTNRMLVSCCTRFSPFSGFFFIRLLFFSLEEETPNPKILGPPWAQL